MALAKELDAPLQAHAFERRMNSTAYTRTLPEARHELQFTLECHPSYQPGADAHLYPAFHWKMRQVKKLAIELVEGNATLVAGTSDIVLNHPFHWLAPKEYNERWFAVGPEQFAAVCAKILIFLSQWVLPFVDQACSPEDLVRLYEKNDPRMMTQLHTHVYIAAAYRILGEEEKAREVVRKHFSKPGIKARYGVLFKSLEME